MGLLLLAVRMRHAARLLTPLAAGALLLVVSAASAATYAERVREKILPNGLKIILLEDHKAPVATFQVWYRAGSRNEQLGKTGLAHLLEHLMFKGTERYGPEEHSKIIQRNGGNENAFTTNDNTTYFATIASDRLGVVIDLEADRMHNLRFDDAQFVPEHKVVMEERRLRTDNDPVAALFEQANAVAYTAHPYEWPVIGWMNDLRQLTREDALEWYRTYYAPGNAFVIAVGDFEADALLAQIEAAFGPIPLGPPVATVRAIEPIQQGERRTILQREAQLPFVLIAYHVPNLRSRDAYALEVFSAVLAGGKSARLHTDLVYRKRLARSAGASYDLTSVDPGLFYLYAQPLPGKSAGQLERELLGQIERLQRHPVDERELTKARNGIEADSVVAQDSLFYQAMLLGQYEGAGDWRGIDDYLPGIRAVTADDVRRVAAFYLTASNRTVAILEPLPVAPGRELPPEGVPRELVH
jgi:zinc protease